MNYWFYPRADSQQDQIWAYTYNTWGEKQAEKYIKGLHTFIQQLADKEIPWQSLPSELLVPTDLDTKIYFGSYQKYYIFFKTLEDGVIGIMSILHKSMDIPVRLGLDLSNIQDK